MPQKKALEQVGRSHNGDAKGKGETSGDVLVALGAIPDTVAGTSLGLGGETYGTVTALGANLTCVRRNRAGGGGGGDYLTS